MSSISWDRIALVGDAGILDYICSPDFEYRFERKEPLTFRLMAIENRLSYVRLDENDKVVESTREALIGPHRRKNRVNCFVGQHLARKLNIDQ